MSESTGYARHFVACNRHDPGLFVPWRIGGKAYGLLTHELAALLPGETGLFVHEGDGLALNPRYSDFDARSDALMSATQWIGARYGKLLRREMYAVVEQWGDAAVARVDRAAVPWFGIRAWGIHVNGFVRKADGIHLWIGRRADDRPADPGKLDNLIGGGQPFGLTLAENLCKEAQEEAGIGVALAVTAKAAGAIDYRMDRHDGVRRDTLFVYDLELPESFVPRNTDGEVASFQLLPVAEVAALVRDTDQFKFNCNLVIIDFLLRHEFITPTDAEYAELMHWLAR